MPATEKLQPISSAVGWTPRAVCGWERPGDVWRFEEGVSLPPCRTIRGSKAGSSGCRAMPPAICGWRRGTTCSGSTRPGACAVSALPKGMGINEFNVRSGYAGARVNLLPERRAGWSVSGPRSWKATSGSSRRSSSRAETLQQARGNRRRRAGIPGQRHARDHAGPQADLPDLRGFRDRLRYFSHGSSFVPIPAGEFRRRRWYELGPQGEITTDWPPAVTSCR